MSNANFVTASKLGINFYKTHTTAQHRLGETTEGTNGTRWVYVRANGVIAQYDAVGIDEDHIAEALTTALAGTMPMFGIAQVAFADDDYGWVCRSGTGILVNVLTLAAADGPLYTTATAGKLDDTATTLVAGITITTTAGGGTEPEECIAANPFIAEGTFP